MKSSNRLILVAALSGILTVAAFAATRGGGAASEPQVATVMVHSSGHAAAGDEGSVSWFVRLTGGLRTEAKPSQVVRLLDVDAQFSVGQICLKHQGRISPVSPEGSEPVVVVLESVNLAQAQLFAAKVLQLEWETGPNQPSSRWQLAIRPASGLTWGALSEHGDLVVELTEAPAQR